MSVPHRRHSVCVLLWRLPKDEVPFAVAICQPGILFELVVSRGPSMLDGLVRDILIVRLRV